PNHKRTVKPPMLKHCLLAAVFVAFSQSLLAQQPPVGGAQIQQVPPPPALPKPDPEIRIEQPNAPALPLADQVKVRVQSLRIVNAHVYSEAELLGVTGFTPGRELTLAELREMAAK